MVFWGCSDVVESGVEHPILDAERRSNAAFSSDSEQPRRASPWGTRRLLTTTRRGEPASYRRVGRLVNRSSSTRARRLEQLTRKQNENQLSYEAQFLLQEVNFLRQRI